MKQLLFAILVLSCLSNKALYALSPKGDVYQAQISVVNFSEKARRGAAEKAMHQILIKISGNSNIASIKAIAEILPNAYRYVKGYRRILQTTDSETKRVDVMFSRETINQILHKAKQPILSQKDVSILLWLAMKKNKNGELELIEHDQDNKKAKKIREIGREKGFSILLPSLDLDDLHMVTPKEIWRLDPEAIEKASVRYGVVNLLAGRLFEEQKNDWRGEWLLISNGDFLHWSTRGETADQNILKVIAHIADALPSRISSDKGELKSVHIRVNHISGLDAYTKVLSYLRKLPIVNEVDVVSVDSDDIVLDISIVGQPSVFYTRIQRDKKLIRVAEDGDDTDLRIYTPVMFEDE